MYSEYANNTSTWQTAEDIFTERLINESASECYWIASEILALEGILDWLRKKMPVSRILDAGCGDGRLFRLFNKYTNNLYALDCDEKKLARAEFTARGAGIENIKIAHCEIEKWHSKYPDYQSSFDLVVCSHVLQHVSTECLTPITTALHDLISENGRVVVSTCFTSARYDEYVACEIEDGHTKNLLIDRAEFETRVSRQLCVAHKFTISSLHQIFENANLNILDLKVFHLIKNGSMCRNHTIKLLTLDDIAGKCESLMDFALDIVIVAEKKN